MNDFVSFLSSELTPAKLVSSVSFYYVRTTGVTFAH